MSEWTDNQKECIDALAEFACGHHHLPRVHEFGSGVAINWFGDLSTFDGNKLTELVRIAHVRAIRFEIASSGPRRVKIIAHKRQHGSRKDLRLHERHPTLEESFESALLSGVRKLVGELKERIGDSAGTQDDEKPEDGYTLGEWFAYGECARMLESLLAKHPEGREG